MNSQALDKIAPALVAAIAEMPAVPMDGKNPFYKSKYATLGAVISATRDILAKHKLAVTQQAISNPEGDAVGIRTVILHESGQFMSWEAVVKIPTQNNPGQEAGKLITYLRRYSLAAALNLYSDEDIDNNSHGQQNGNGKGSRKVSNTSQSSHISNNDKPAILSIAQAGKVTDSKGTPYIEIPSERLSYMSGSINKAINNNGHDQERLGELQTKAQAIAVILKERNQGGIDNP